MKPPRTSTRTNANIPKIQAAANLNGNTITLFPDFQMGITNKTPSYLSKFPTGKVPAFEGADGTNLIESDAIAQYCAESGPAAGQLMGSTPAERALIRQWIAFADGEVLSNITQLALWRLGIAKYSEETEKAAFGGMVKALDVLEAQLKGKKWLNGGEKISMADISVAGGLVWGFGMVIDQELRGKYTGVVEWYERVLEVEGVKEAFGPKNFVEKRKEYEA